MTREIVLDTETTGMDPADGHRIIEIGCVELDNHLPTGKTWHRYINPEREVDAGAVAVHGIKTEFLKDKPTFGEVVGDFVEFIGDATLVIHNAEFDTKFLNAELKTFGFPSIKPANVIDTLMMARKKFPGSPANLDALCRRFNIDLSGRELHGALLDAQLLAAVYLELAGGRQHGLGLGGDEKETEKKASSKDNEPDNDRAINRPLRKPRAYKLSLEEENAHMQMVAGIKNALWTKN